jgi:hypothetical protein
VAAHELHPPHRCNLLDAADRIGGHVNTIDGAAAVVPAPCCATCGASSARRALLASNEEKVTLGDFLTGRG